MQPPLWTLPADGQEHYATRVTQAWDLGLFDPDAATTSADARSIIHNLISARDAVNSALAETQPARPLNWYEEKQEQRRQRLDAAAARAASEAGSRFTAAHKAVEGIPFGQPILVGHHSERRHRRDIARMDTNMRKGVEAKKAAEELERRAEAVGTGGVSSDDPDAVEKLEAQLAKKEARQQLMTAANKLVRAAERRHSSIEDRVAYARDGLAALGFSEQRTRELFTPDFVGRTGFASYELSNNNANIRRIKERIEALKKLPAREAAVQPLAGDGWKLYVEDNRVCLAFDERLPKERYQKLRRSPYAFVWSRENGRFQRKFSTSALYWAKEFVGYKEVCV